MRGRGVTASATQVSVYRAFSLRKAKETVLHLMVEAAEQVKDAVETRRTMRRARRFRKWRRPQRFANRLHEKPRIPPSTRSRWQAKARVIKHLQTMLPLTDVVVEDVQGEVTQPKPQERNACFLPCINDRGLHRRFR
jgi:hypothetical protein